MLNDHPLFRCLIPLAAGITCGSCLFWQKIALPLMPLAAGAIALFILSVAFYFIRITPLRRLSQLLPVAIFFLWGAGSMYWYLSQAAYPFPETETVYRVEITEKPEEKERSILCPAKASGKQVLLYFPKDSASSAIRRGDELLVSSLIALPPGNGNPDEFDYPAYLLRKGISGTGYVAGGKWFLLTHRPERTLKQLASDSRQKIISIYRKLGFTGDELSVLSALTVGYKEELSEEIRESFSVSGASHVLALSGLHMGFIYGLLLFLLNVVTGRAGFSLLPRTLTILACLWCFAFLTGLSPSVVRSAIMFSLMSLSQLRGGRVFSFNSLISAAFIMLLCRPAWLFDAGFQLSFTAVAAILLIQPRLYAAFTAPGKAAGYLWGIVSVSVAAQVGVTPLILFYFSRFSTHFLLTNLLVIPLVTLIMYSAALMLAFTPLPAVQAIIAYPVKGLLILLNSSVRWVEQIPFASLDGIRISGTEVALLYAVILLSIAYVTIRKAKFLINALVCIWLFTGYRTWQVRENTPKESIAFYNVRHAPAVHCISSGGKSWLVYADSVDGGQRLSRSLSAYWNRLRLSEPKVITGDYSEGSFQRAGHMITFNGKRICIINDNSWQAYESAAPFRADYLYLCGGYTGRVEQLLKLFSATTVILDASLPGYRKDAWLEECDTLNLPCRSLSDGSSIFSVFEDIKI